MRYRVELTARAVADMERIYAYIHVTDSVAAANWFRALEEDILRLADAPRIGSVTREHSHVRHMLYGRKPHTYRVLYKLDDAHHLVQVIHIRHGRRAAFNDADIQ